MCTFEEKIENKDNLLVMDIFEFGIMGDNFLFVLSYFQKCLE